MNPINPTSISISHTPRRRGLRTPGTIRENSGLMITSCIAILLLFTAFVTPAFAATKLADPGPECVFSTMGTKIDTMTINNSIYCVSVWREPGYHGVGTYTIATSTGHPVPDKNVFYGGFDQEPGSTYLTVKAYNTSKEYVSTTSSRPAPSSGCTVVSLDTCSPATTQNGNSILTTWTTPENLLINQIIAVEGSTPDDSMVRVTTSVTNNNAIAQSVGIRYVWDLMIDDEDGSWFAERFPDANWTDTECEWDLPTFGKYSTTDDPDRPTLIVWGNLTGFALAPPSTTPDLLQFAAWGGVFDCAFDYTTNHTTLAGPGTDSAIVYYWGNDAANAMTIEPGESVTVTQYLYVTPPPPRDVPTLTSIGIVALVGLLVCIGAGVIMRGRRSD